MTSAAAIVVLVAGSFAFADVVLIKALGVGVALAVALDATVVRALLVPSTMRLLGRWNWWMPERLRRCASGRACRWSRHERRRSAMLLGWTRLVVVGCTRAASWPTRCRPRAGRAVRARRDPTARTRSRSSCPVTTARTTG